MKETVVLAYSGGLDTSTILKWLLDKGYEVICYIADVGQNEDFEKAKQNAFKIGAKEVFIDDLKEEFIESYVFKALKANAVYEGSYLLGTSLARPLIALKQVELAKKIGATVLAHGCTGKGNDQVRFELVYHQFFPGCKIISPWKEEEFLSKFQGRKDMIEYCNSNGLKIEASADKPYSRDENLLHTSYESGILEDIWNDKDYKSIVKNFTMPEDAPEQPEKIEIEFKDGLPANVKNLSSGKSVNGSIEIFNYLNSLGSNHGIGIVDMVESRFVGMKSRGVYVTPAGSILWKAHKHLEGITLDKELINLKEMLSPKYAQIIYNGFWFSPELSALDAFMEDTQKYVNGKVKLSLYKGNMLVMGMQSENSLYCEEIASMDVHGNYDQKDAKGFITINALRLKQFMKANSNAFESKNMGCLK